MMGQNTASHWDEDPTFPVADWQAEVANDDTRLGYHEWVAAQYDLREETCNLCCG